MAIRDSEEADKVDCMTSGHEIAGNANRLTSQSNHCRGCRLLTADALLEQDQYHAEARDRDGR